MIWIVLALLNAILTGIVLFLDKKLLLKEHTLEFSTIFALTNAALAFLLIPFVDFHISKLQLILVYLFSWISTLAFYFMAKATRHIQLSSFLPLTNLIPAIVALLGMIFLKEYLSLVQWSGLILLLIGSYMLQTRDITHYKVFFHKIARSKGLHFAFLSFFLYALASIVDRYVVVNLISAPTFLFYILLFTAVNFLLMSVFFNRGVKDIKHGFSEHWKIFLLAGFLTFAARVLQIYAVSLETPSLVLSVKRLGVLIGLVLAGKFLHENNLERKIFASVIMLIGVVLIVV